ncbi:DUF3857 domain-containing transglutaminase family protein [Sphingosinicella sp. LY1275]|uniref:DUF3857 domain-containing transglutaminase family protein n=1 Tax=Sphingosinicella sp. LY1275 TaxID=3095379 RepID=UPI002ADEE931|nr:DUF3857 domain-containing protein [Sphingosinicella sp. LY1275]MEA1015109.1 DUF3857 domain-containing protein [Sphingosinicella sp. LY1275]
MAKLQGGAALAGRLFACALVCILLLVASEAGAAGQIVVRKGPPPAFVVPIAIPEPVPARLRQVEGGFYDLLYDTLVRVDGPLETTYRRRAYKIVDRSGLEKAAQIEVGFDPSYEGLTLHHVSIVRDGRPINVINRTDIDVIRQESELGKGILTGVHTAVFRLPDVRVGDVIDVGWSWAARPPLWPGHYFAGHQLAWGVPVGLTRYRVDVPAGQRLDAYRYRGAPAARLQRVGGRDIREWTAIDADPVREDRATPQWHRPWQRVSVSTMADWGEVVQWALPLYVGTSEFPTALADEAARIERQGGTDAVKAIKALRLVQDNIRYTSMSIGTGSYRPRRPADVVRQGWGDCKDKAQLLVTLLRRLGIEAWPALTDVDEGAALPREAPSPGAFDHVVVLARVNGKDHWLDPTLAHQGGTLDTLAPLTYDYALPIRTGQRNLMRIQQTLPSGPTIEAVETYNLRPDGIRLEVVTTYRGGEADNIRASVAGGAVATKEAEYLQFYASDYPGLRTQEPLRIEDDREAGRLIVHESYFLPASTYADGALLKAFPIYVAAFSDTFTYQDGGRRRHPMILSHPVNRTHKIVLVTPGMSVSPLDETRIDGKAFTFSLAQKREGDTLTLLFSLVSKGSLLAADDFVAYRKDADALKSNVSWQLAIGEGAALGEGIGAALLLLFIVGAIVIAFGFAHARAHKDTERDGEILYPVPRAKFLTLSITTWGLYAVYWFWRNWRWERRHSSPGILPFWRAFFGIIWLYPLFNAANARCANPLPQWLGGVAAAGYLTWIVGTSVAEQIYTDSFVPTALACLAAIFVLPTLVAVNRCNAPDTVRNGQWSWVAVAAAVAGSGFTILLPFVG